MATDEGGLRERKKRETRFALSQAAIRLTIERGWNNVTVEDIAAAANVSERTFRNYFANKAEAIVATHVERGRRTAEALRERPAGEPLWDALVNAVVAQFEPPPGHDGTVPDGYAAALQKLLAEPAVQYEVFRAHATAQDELTAAVADRTGTDAGDLYPQTVAAVISAGIGTALTRWTRNPTGSIGSLLREVFDAIRAGLPDPR
jgi:AcrR family transcriptional regulator